MPKFYTICSLFTNFNRTSVIGIGFLHLPFTTSSQVTSFLETYFLPWQAVLGEYLPLTQAHFQIIMRQFN